MSQQGDPGDALLAAARFWTRVLEHAAKLSPAELIEVRYEDFCSDVRGTLGTILHGLDLESDSFPFRRCPATLSSRNSYWLERASTPELAAISKIQAEQLTRHGYPLTQIDRSAPVER